MNINYSGWSEKYGSYNYNIPFDESRTDFEVKFDNGQVLRQCSAFERVTADWNCDGDIYTEFGANFVRIDADGTERSGREFWSPDNLVAELIDGLYGDDWPPRDRVVSISGITVHPPKVLPSLNDQIACSEKRQIAQDVERNRKMNALGVRGPGESWAR